MNEFLNKWWTQKNSFNGLLKKLERHWHSRQTDSQEVSALKKMLTWLTIWFWVVKIHRRLT